MFWLLAALHHFFATPADDVVWEERAPFTELLLSWNTSRPAAGRLTFLVSVEQQDRWSEWLYFGEWGCDGQMLFNDTLSSARTARGVVLSTSACTGFRVRTIASGGAQLHDLRLTAALSPSETPCDTPLTTVLLPHIFKQSQVTLRHPRYLDVALPTATAIAVNTILGRRAVEPATFIANVYDSDFDQYEEWPLSVAEAAHHLGTGFAVEVERLYGFEALYAHLRDGFPVVVPLKGSLPGAPRPFYLPHAVCVVGYDAATDVVHCVDSLFPNDRATLVGYPRANFCTAWKTQSNLAIVFGRKS